jgi:hypothetical protein
MPHQDTGSVNGSAYNHQALKQALQWLLEDVSWSDVVFRLDCTWVPQLLAVTAMLWAWSDEKTLKERFLTARKIAWRMFASRKAPARSYQAFTKLLRKWTTVLMAAVQTLFRQQMRRRLAQRFTLAGFVPFGVDGSRFGLPRTASHERAFASSKKRQKAKSKKDQPARRKAQRQPRLSKEQKAALAQAKKAASPQLWVTVLWHLGCGLPWSWRLGPTDSSEREHMRQMIAELPLAALLVADAGFPGYLLWSALVGAGCQMVMRVGSNVRLLRRLGYVKERGDLVYLWPDQVAAQSQPPIVLRMVVIHNGRHPVYLVTTVLNQRRLSNQQVIEFYRLRWGIELFYRHVKQTYECRKLRSHAAENAPVEAAWALLGMWAMAFYAQCYLKRRVIPPSKISVAQMLRAFRKPMRAYQSRPDPGEDLHSLLDTAIIDSYHRASKASRDYPRKKQERTAGPPRIVLATTAQVQKAREIRKEMKLRLTA